ncbi:hypothetical protein F4821DRAFT_237059 [Hypoxylon rubiginosum]|uniref:Uncharacterized protein n=1 Tax=Hypoxylon rubiginosum TaxID=110542 RepID=A0ACC0D3K3_9PEZI|nr:hypothetical protein F4821DRAFT_237059 [Hypoxylon rubiginosum]
MLAFNSSGRNDGPGPKTPEPLNTGDELQLPPPPRPRLRLKRRHVSNHLNAPATQQFLASVAAADVPVPSIEVEGDDPDSMDIYEQLHARTFSPPKTPAIELEPSHSLKFPDWYVESEWSCSESESSPEYESSRPSTAFSTQTSASLFSQFSHASEDGDCLSPELIAQEFPKLQAGTNVGVSRKERPRRAPWTKAMDSHLWSTYLLYLQDPRVTPIRSGRSQIPPNGVCLRVARQAKRSWKGSKNHLNVDTKSGSSTPTAEASKPYMEWPHTCAATRAHLRELCRLKATTTPGQHKSPSPAPFHKAAYRRWNRRSTPAGMPSVFSAQDMAFSLAVSTSDTMRPDAPLAQLTSSQNEPFPELVEATGLQMETTPETELPRLSSPGVAKSYGPSSSSTLAAGINLSRQSNTLDSRKLLKSPARLTRSRSGTQKRRSVKSLEDLPRKRPSISAAFWKATGSSENLVQSVDSFTQKTLGEESLLSPLEAENSTETPYVQPRRLGSPFSGSSSFPNRLSTPISFNLTALRRPFATVQQANEASSGAQSSPKSSLASRLAYLDQRLKELRNRGDRRRSQSPL